NKAVQASFAAVAPGHHTLTVHDNGDGTITSLPPGINCGHTCSAAFVAGAEVTLTPTPAPGQRFAGWSGACTGVGACTVWMGNVEHVTGTFVPDAPPRPIPALSQWALLLLGLLIAGVVFQRLRVKPSRRVGML
ncbi:MAG: IPTL-CTERM sorting domain-containing protein, partial [Thiohalocapsa sp.]